MLQGKTMHVEGENCNFATLSLTRACAFHCDLQLHLVHLSVHHLSRGLNVQKKYSIPLNQDRYHIWGLNRMDFQPWEPPPPPPLDRNVSVMLSSLHTPLPSCPPSPPLTEKDGTHLPAGHPNVTYFALLAYNHAMSPTFPPIFLHPPWCIWPKWGLVSKGRKNTFSEIEKKVFDCSKAVPAVPTYRRHSI